MKLTDLLHHCSQRLAEEGAGAAGRGLDAPIAATGGRWIATAGTLHLYEFQVPATAPLREDLPITLIPATNFTGDLDSTEGFVVGHHHGTVLVQTFDSFGPTIESATIVPD
ncbi:MAG: hypothetical protein HY205_05600, partial [Nitrospirae bacterium]|nr:hypothetical protein [Nitrospirota bacterium]